jgi:glycosyltransferase involved in cell wall biosynthesis
MIKKIVKRPEDIYLSLCGNEFIYNSYLASMRKKNPDEVIKRQNPTNREKKVFKTFSPHIPNVIPVMYDYAEPYRASKLAENFKLQPTIPLPLDLTDIRFENTIKDKLVIFYGLNRASKGTHIICEALNIIKNKFPNVEVIIDGNMPFDEYLKVIRRANIIVDQCYTFGYGMNAIYSMAMGKVVLSCNEPECQREFKRSDIPILNIEPDVNQIVNTIENLILNPFLIQDLSLKSRRFVEEFHESKIVAKQYIDVFMKNGL